MKKLNNFKYKMYYVILRKKAQGALRQHESNTQGKTVEGWKT